MTKKIYCYVGDLQNGYTLYDGFNFQMEGMYQSTVDTTETGLFEVGPWGLKFMDGNNILFAAAAANFHTGTGYEYSRIYAINPNTGEIMDTVDVAAWNYAVTGAYNNRTNNIASGYASTYSIDYDAEKNLYSQSYYGWTVEKWVYSGTLPTIPLTITSVKKSNETVPTKFALSQNYPNPFNPTTVIEFSLPESANITLSVYSITGQLVKTLAKGNYKAGNYKVSFDASGLSSGTYIYRLTNGKSIIARKMLLLK
jgi:predicted secreted protein